MENPATSVAWKFDGILATLIEKARGKFIISDQCAYGKKDAESGRPVKKPTGWISNSEVLLNHIRKRCSCPWGAHEQVVGSNKEGPRSKQAAAYPPALCAAICRGVRETMILDYATAFAGGDFQNYRHAFLVEEVVIEETESEAEEEPAEDSWRFEGEDRLVRIHWAPRKLLFIPFSSTAPPCDYRDILPGRRTRMTLLDGTRREHEGDWWHGRRESMDFTWTGESEFRLAQREQEVQEQPEQPPQEGPGQEVDPPWEESAAPWDSAVPCDDHQDHVEKEVPEQPEQPPQEGPRELVDAGLPVERDQRILRRRGHRSRQLQRGFWVENDDESVLTLMENTLEYVRQEGGEQWNRLDIHGDLGKGWASLESANAEVRLILCSASARRMKKPQPHSTAAEVPLRKSFLLLEDNQVLVTDWEAWSTMAAASQVRPLVAPQRKLSLVLYGTELGNVAQHDDDDRWRARERDRDRQWQALPRELKLAIRRIHVNLGHATVPATMRALRISRASEVALKACRLFRCPDCPRLQEPKEARPSKLPTAEEFNVQIGLDIFSEKDCRGHSWTWLNILCQGTTFQVVALLGETFANPKGSVILEALSAHWLSWAGYPERGVVTDRAKYFLAELADDFSTHGTHGCTFDSDAKAAPWQIGQIERHGGLWKEAFRKMVLS